MKTKNMYIYLPNGVGKNYLARLAEEYQTLGLTTKIEEDRLIVFTKPAKKKKKDEPKRKFGKVRK